MCTRKPLSRLDFSLDIVPRIALPLLAKAYRLQVQQKFYLFH
jgi:hypothetical protein